MLAAMPNIIGPAMSRGTRSPIAKHERTTGGSAFYQIYATRDGRHLVLGGAGDEVRRATCSTALGRPDSSSCAQRGPGPHQQPVIDYLSGVFARSHLRTGKTSSPIST